MGVFPLGILSLQRRVLSTPFPRKTKFFGVEIIFSDGKYYLNHKDTETQRGYKVWGKPTSLGLTNLPSKLTALFSNVLASAKALRNSAHSMGCCIPPNK